MPYISTPPTSTGVRLHRFWRSQRALPWLVVAMVGMASGSAQAERADRSKPINVDSDRSTVDLRKRIFNYSGNVVISQGSLNIRAERVEVRELANGRRVAMAYGSDAKPTTFRQKGDARDEVFEGSADRIEYDDQSDTVRFVGNASARRLLGNTVTGEMSGAVISYDNLNEVFNLEGQSTAGARGTGRARAVFAPPAQTSSGAPPPATPSSGAPAASAPSTTVPALPPGPAASAPAPSR